MDRLFRIDFYPQDWIIDTARLTPEERGVYIQIIALIYSNRGPIENDPVWIAGVSGCSSRMVKSVISKLEEKGFVQFSGGKITQKRAENELNIKRKHLELSSKGGRNRAENEREYKENNYLDSSEGVIPLSSSSPSPSPSPTQLEEKEPKGSKKKPENKNEIPENIYDEFCEFWKIAEKKVGKGAAEKAYMKAREFEAKENINPAWIAANRKWKTLAENEKRFIPHPSTWLNEKRWEDEFQLEPEKPKTGIPFAKGCDAFGAPIGEAVFDDY
jgi:uncharacterized protein YdaU (DUF1376 family)